MFKKRAFYLSIALLTVPLVAVADPLQADTTSPVQQALSQLPQACPVLAPRVNAPMLRMLQGFYQGQNDQPVWSVNGRLSALQGELAQLADDGLDPDTYKLPVAGDLCADIGISQQYLQALQDLHYGRLQQSRFEPVWHASEVAQDRQARILAFAGPGLADLPRAFEQARPQNELYQNLRRVYARQRQQPLPQWQPLASGPLLRPGAEDARVPELARRLVSEGYLSHLPATVDHHYSNELVAAVKQVGTVFGVVAGAFIAAWHTDELRWEAFDDDHEMRRHVAGAALMGFGGILTGGCTIGQGITAGSVMALSWPIAIAGMMLGARIGIAVLVDGSPRELIRRRFDAWHELLRRRRTPAVTAANKPSRRPAAPSDAPHPTAPHSLAE